MHDDHGAHADDEWGRIGKSSRPVRARICSAADLNESPGLTKFELGALENFLTETHPKFQHDRVEHDDHGNSC